MNQIEKLKAGLEYDIGNEDGIAINRRANIFQ